MHYIISILLIFILTSSCKFEKSKKNNSPIPTHGFIFIDNEIDEKGSKILRFVFNNNSIDLGVLTGDFKKLESKEFEDFNITSNSIEAVKISGANNLILYAVENNSEYNIFFRNLEEDSKDTTKNKWQKISLDIIGRWEKKEQPELWMAFDAFYTYSDEYEDGKEYTISNDSLYLKDRLLMCIQQISDKTLTVKERSDKFWGEWNKANLE